MTGDDHRPLKIRVRVDPDLAELIPGFLENRRKDVHTLRSALARNDIDVVRLLGHRMKGDGGGYGFNAISDIGRRLEQGAKNGTADDIRRCLDELDEYLRRVDVVYE